MTKYILSCLIILSLTACQERKNPQPQSSEMTEEVFSNVQEDILSNTSKQIENENDILVDIPILEDELPVVTMANERKESTQRSIKSEIKQSSGGVITDGLDMATMRISHSPEKTRIVFDSYTQSGNKVSVSGHYNFKYVPDERRIVLIVNGYRKFSALGSDRKRTFSKSSIVKKVYLDKYLDDSGFKCIIDLRMNAKVNVFDIKEPGRIVVDITPQ